MKSNSPRLTSVSPRTLLACRRRVHPACCTRLRAFVHHRRTRGQLSLRVLPIQRARAAGAGADTSFYDSMAMVDEVMQHAPHRLRRPRLPCDPIPARWALDCCSSRVGSMAGWPEGGEGREGEEERRERGGEGRGDGGRRRGSRGGRREAAAGSRVGRERAAGRRKCGT